MKLEIGTIVSYCRNTDGGIRHIGILKKCISYRCPSYSRCIGYLTDHVCGLPNFHSCIEHTHSLKPATEEEKTKFILKRLTGSV